MSGLGVGVGSESAGGPPRGGAPEWARRGSAPASMASLSGGGAPRGTQGKGGKKDAKSSLLAAGMQMVDNITGGSGGRYGRAKVAGGRLNEVANILTLDGEERSGFDLALLEELVAGCQLLQEVQRPVLLDLLRGAEYRTAEAKSILQSPHKPRDAMYVILAGTCKLYMQGYTGVEDAIRSGSLRQFLRKTDKENALGTHVATFSAGDSFGERCVCMPADKSPATLLAAEQVHLLRISAELWSRTQQALSLSPSIIMYKPYCSMKVLRTPAHLRNAHDVDMLTDFFKYLPATRRYPEPFRRELAKSVNMQDAQARDILYRSYDARDKQRNGGMYILLQGMVGLHLKANRGKGARVLDAVALSKKNPDFREGNFHRQTSAVEESRAKLTGVQRWRSIVRTNAELAELIRAAQRELAATGVDKAERNDLMTEAKRGAVTASPREARPTGDKTPQAHPTRPRARASHASTSSRFSEFRDFRFSEASPPMSGEPSSQGVEAPGPEGRTDREGKVRGSTPAPVGGRNMLDFGADDEDLIFANSSSESDESGEDEDSFGRFPERFSRNPVSPSDSHKVQFVNVPNETEEANSLGFAAKARRTASRAPAFMAPEAALEHIDKEIYREAASQVRSISIRRIQESVADEIEDSPAPHRAEADMEKLFQSRDANKVRWVGGMQALFKNAHVDPTNPHAIANVEVELMAALRVIALDISIDDDRSPMYALTGFIRYCRQQFDGNVAVRSVTRPSRYQTRTTKSTGLAACSASWTATRSSG